MSSFWSVEKSAKEPAGIEVVVIPAHWFVRTAPSSKLQLYISWPAKNVGFDVVCEFDFVVVIVGNVLIVPRM